MKSAEEYWNENKSLVSDFNDEKYYVLFQSQFYKALSFHDSEIINKVNEIDLEYYETVTSTQNHPDILRAELNDLIEEIAKLKSFIKVE